MATAIGFKKVGSLPASPLITTFYLVNNEDLYIGSKKLNNENDIADAIRRIEDLEDGYSGGSGSGSGSGPGLSTRLAKNVQVEDAGNNFQSNNVEDALAELVDKINLAGGNFSEFVLVRIQPGDFSSTATEGGRTWKVASVPISKYTTKLVHAIPCGNTLGEMPTKEQEQRVFAMRGFFDPDNNRMLFYSPAVPDADITIAVEGIEL